MAAPAHVATTSTPGDETPVALPSGSGGRLMLAVHDYDISATPLVPSAFTFVDSHFHDASGERTQVWLFAALASEAGAGPFSFAGSGFASARLSRYTHPDGIPRLVGTPGKAGTRSSGTLTMPTVTTPEDECRLDLSVTGYYSSVAAVSGWTNIAGFDDWPGRNAHNALTREAATAGSYGGEAGTITSGVTTNVAALTVILAPPESDPPPPPGGMRPSWGWVT